jgi:hypothetical protein
VTTFPAQLSVRAAKMLASTQKLAQNAHQRLNTMGSQVSALQPGDWELLTLENGWSNVSGYIPAQVRIQQNGMSMLVGHIEGGSTGNGTAIGTLGAGYYNTVHAHAFTCNVVSGAASVPVAGSISGETDTNGLSDAYISGSSASANGPGAHTHGTSGGSGGYIVAGDGHVHTNTSGNLNPATPVNYNTVILNLSTSGVLTLQSCSSAASQLSFSELLPLLTS